MICVQRPNTVKMSILPKLVYNYNSNQNSSRPLKNRNQQADSKIYMEKRRAWNSQNSFKAEQSWKAHAIWFDDLLSRFRNYYSVVYTYWWKDRHTDEQNRVQK